MNLSHSKNTFQRLVLLILHSYSNYVSYFFPSTCRFYPSCSQYAQQAVMARGVIRGLLLTAQRLLRCHPWCEGGFDPVPETRTSQKKSNCAAHSSTPNLTED